MTRNISILERLRSEFDTPIHYYHDRFRTPVDEVLSSSTPEEREAFEAYVPTDGHWGSRRNRLALLAACHGGQDALYLHLDNDTPLLEIDHGKIVASNRDVLGAFKNGLRRAGLEGKRGFSSNIVGVRDANTSQLNRAEPNFRLTTPFRYGPTRGALGPGRITTFELMAIPYRPYGANSDNRHAIDAEYYLGGNQYNSAHRTTGATIAHIGFRGPTYYFDPAVMQRVNMAIPPEAHEAWAKLIRRAAESARWRV